MAHVDPIAFDGSAPQALRLDPAGPSAARKATVAALPDSAAFR